MNFLQRALKNTTRKKTKSILLVLTFFLIGNLVIIGVGISSAASRAKVLTRQSMRAVVNYTIDYDAWSDAYQTMSDDEIQEAVQSLYISADELDGFFSDERVVTYSANYTDTAVVNIEAEPVGNDYESYSSSYYTTDSDGNMVEVTYTEPNFMLSGNLTDDLIELHDGTYTIVEGRFYSQDDIDDASPVCLISQQVATRNGLGVGDTITIDFSNNYSYMELDIDESMYSAEVEIIGIYSTTEVIDTTADNFSYMSAYESPYNKILMPAYSIINLTLPLQQASYEYYMALYPEYYSEDDAPTVENSLYVSTVTFLLTDPLLVDEFIADYEGSITHPYRMFTADNETFNALARPLDSIEIYANIIVWIVVINAVVIITLVTALTLKTREFEIGVLLSIGASKFKVVAQLFMELLIVALLGFTLSVVTGSMIANQVGKALLNYQVAQNDSYATDDDSDDYNYYDAWSTDYFSEVSTQDLVDNYNVEISPLIIGEIYVAGIGIVLVSILIPSLMIMRYNPKRILTSSL